MFDISWSELLILGIVTLVFVGPKELPVFLRTIGRYVGMLKRQAGEFREQFDSAMREAELDQIRKDMMNVKTDVESSIRDAERSVSSEFDGARSELEKVAEAGSGARPSPLVDPATDAATFDLDAHDADGIPLHRPAAAGTGAAAAEPAPSKAQAAADAAAKAAAAASPSAAAKAAAASPSAAAKAVAASPSAAAKAVPDAVKSGA
jgi:sec-independent protein translocase protein TatB